MAVIINEFRIEPQKQPPQAAGDQVPITEPPKETLNPADVTSIMRRRQERALRIWAH